MPVTASDLQVITMVSNPVRFRSRYELFNRFREHIEGDCGGRLWLVEVAFGDRAHSVADPRNPRHLMLRTDAELWHKENALNVLMQRLPSDWKYVAWVDADVQFLDHRRVLEETVHQLQHHSVVQMFENAVDLGPNGQAMDKWTSLGRAQLDGRTLPPRKLATAAQYHPYAGYQFGHSGYAWAARRDALEGVGMLMDRAILGAGDHHMAWSVLGQGLDTVPNTMTEGYRRMVREWQSKALLSFRGDMGYVPGTLVHSWHGKKVDRKYVDRWKILARAGFDPYRDVAKDSQGLLRLVDDGSQRFVRLRNDLRAYFRARNEDSVDLSSG